MMVEIRREGKKEIVPGKAGKRGSGRFLNRYFVPIMKFASILIIAALFLSCAAERKAEKNLEKSAVVSTYRTLSDHNDYYFEIRENNYFRFYMKLFDSIPNTKYSGNYTQTGDTLYLKFFKKEGAAMIGSKALVNSVKKEIVFFDDQLVIKRSFPFN